MRAILFDMFGTLVVASASRTEQGYHETHALLRKQGMELGYEQFLKTWCDVMASLDRWSVQTGREYPMIRVASGFLRVVGAEASSEFTEALMASYLREWCRGVHPIPGVPGLLTGLARCYRLGIVSNTHHAPLVNTLLKQYGIRQHFDVLITSVEHGRRKPDQSIFEAALGTLGVPADQTVFVGDSYDADYLGSRRAGLNAILIDPGNTRELSQSDCIGSILELREHPLLRG